eukprot:Lithocolla_globosa_v1_NODE_959_length_3029_cov_25.901143.p1 type:complete len:480 gc:universal NODE_959_length_3029_cov_25.901143:1460-2899(+)
MASLQLISVEQDPNDPDALDQFHLVPETVKALLAFREPFYTVVVAGVTRVGKSTLLNLMLDKMGQANRANKQRTLKQCFASTPFAAPCTAGVWVWSELISLPGVRRKVLLVDTEGLDVIGRSSHLAKTLGLSLLISTVLIYNIRNYIGDSTMNSLGVMKQVVDQLQLEKLPAFPHLMLLLRDKTLDYTDPSGQFEVNEEIYLDQLLAIRPKDDQFNDLRRLLRGSFPSVSLNHTTFPEKSKLLASDVDPKAAAASNPDFMQSFDYFWSCLLHRLQNLHQYASFGDGSWSADEYCQFITDVTEQLSKADVHIAPIFKELRKNQARKMVLRSFGHFLLLMAQEMRRYPHLQGIFGLNPNFDPLYDNFSGQITTANMATNPWQQLQDLEKFRKELLEAKDGAKKKAEQFLMKEIRQPVDEIFTQAAVDLTAMIDERVVLMETHLQRALEILQERVKKLVSVVGYLLVIILVSGQVKSYFRRH